MVSHIQFIGVMNSVITFIYWYSGQCNCSQFIGVVDSVIMFGLLVQRTVSSLST